MTISKVVVIITIILIVLALLALFWRMMPSCDAVTVIPLSIEVAPGAKVLGFNTDNNFLNFGRASPSSVVQRSIIVEHSVPADIQISFEGDIASWVAVTPSFFSLGPTQQRTVSIDVTVPEAASEGVYKGEVVVCIKE